VEKKYFFYLPYSLESTTNFDDEGQEQIFPSFWPCIYMPYIVYCVVNGIVICFVTDLNQFFYV